MSTSSNTHDGFNPKKLFMKYTYDYQSITLILQDEYESTIRRKGRTLRAWCGFHIIIRLLKLHVTFDWLIHVLILAQLACQVMKAWFSKIHELENETVRLSAQFKSELRNDFNVATVKSAFLYGDSSLIYALVTYICIVIKRQIRYKTF